MEEKNKSKSNNYNNINSPILNYYSHFINQSYSHNDSTNFNLYNQKNYNHRSISKLVSENKKINQISIINEQAKESIQEDNKNNNLIKREKNNLNIESENNNLEKETNNPNSIKIKSLKPEDLIPTKIKGRTILRINPLVYKNESYEFLSSNLYILLKDQLACKYLQEKLDTDTFKAIYYFYPSLLQNLLLLIKDSFANYFIQKICYYLNEEQIDKILEIIRPEFFDISSDNHGTRAIQGIMNTLQTKKLRNSFFDIIKPIFINLIYDLNGIHIIYKFINEFPEFLNATNNIIADNCVNLGTHKRGCFFVQNYLMMLRGNHNNHYNFIIEKLLNICLILITDKVGNYLVQFLLTLGNKGIISCIVNKIINNISYYCKLKYSNFVIEKLISSATFKDKNRIIEKISSPEILTDLIFNEQGNYIIMKALIDSNDEQKNCIYNIINNLEEKIRQFPHGENFLSRINTIKNSCNKYSKYKNNDENKK